MYDNASTTISDLVTKQLGLTTALPQPLDATAQRTQAGPLQAETRYDAVVDSWPRDADS
jgi:hypothetical protein